MLKLFSFRLEIEMLNLVMKSVFGVCHCYVTSANTLMTEIPNCKVNRNSFYMSGAVSAFEKKAEIVFVIIG